MLKVSITARLFLTLLIVSMLTAVGVGLATRWSFQRGFQGYLNEVEARRMEAMAYELGRAYQAHGSWDFIRGNREAWERTTGAIGRERATAPHQGGDSIYYAVSGIAPRRLGLVDMDGRHLAGNVQQGDDLRYQPVLVDGKAVGTLKGAPLRGLQHKYDQTVLLFPSSGQTCHAYCTFCFRWPQFVGMDDMKFDARESDELVNYLKLHPEVTDVLITGGDPMIMNTRSLAAFIEPLLDPALEHIQNIRIGTKAVAYWPQRFVTDRDADDLMRLFERVVAAGKNLAVMGHYSHAAELRQEIAQKAVKRIVASGATLRMQGPLIRHINEDPKSWAELWQTGVRLGAIRYYMFVERDTGPRRYFQLPLARAHEIFQAAYQLVSGLSRTVRGPSMSAFPGKVVIDGIVTIHGEKVFALQFLQARNADWVRKPFYAAFDPEATWLDDLKPAFGKDKFFFETAAPLERKVIPLLPAGAGRTLSHTALAGSDAA